MYYIYMLRCEDNSIYTGITNNLDRRMEEHFSRGKKCAKYTSSHKAKKIETVWKTEDKILASKLEFYIKKKLNKIQKEKLISKNSEIEDYFKDVLECDKYKRIEFI